MKDMNSTAYSSCQLCPRSCKIDRNSTVGFCGQSNELRVARAALHMWEEPCISGNEGSGTVFFCGCTLGCVYCQNAEISRRRSTHGKIITVEQLADCFLNLQSQHANNINLVTPTMFSPHITSAISIARSRGLTIPVVYNTSGYERCEIISSLAGSVDIWLPDFKYLSSELAAKYSNASDYPDHAKSALRSMVDIAGSCKFDERGMMTRGVIVRHLLLPWQLNESIKVIEYLYSEYGNDIYYSLMSQYTPVSTLDRESYPELNRRVTTYEYNKLIEYALSLGIKNAYIQDGRSAKESFIPSFNGEGL
ncbi:MAG: radical SAM protein [Clostridiales bacterium]|nr:radical SAM protein [Clostridiales bacterium]